MLLAPPDLMGLLHGLWLWALQLTTLHVSLVVLVNNSFDTQCWFWSWFEMGWVWYLDRGLDGLASVGLLLLLRSLRLRRWSRRLSVFPLTLGFILLCFSLLSEATTECRFQLILTVGRISAVGDLKLSLILQLAEAAILHAFCLGPSCSIMWDSGNNILTWVVTNFRLVFKLFSGSELVWGVL